MNKLQAIILLFCAVTTANAGWSDSQGRYHRDREDSRGSRNRDIRLYQTIPGTTVESKVRPSYILRDGRLYHPIEGTNIPSLGRPVKPTAPSQNQPAMKNGDVGR
jgi:hypothetical protein